MRRDVKAIAEYRKWRDRLKLPQSLGSHRACIFLAAHGQSFLTDFGIRNAQKKASELRWTLKRKSAEGAMNTSRNRDQKVLDYFLDREGKPINTFILERIAGRRAWRTRVSGARALARTLRRDIVNTQHRVYRRGKLQHVNSFYTLVRLPKPSVPLLRGHDTGFVPR
jgi:hypothetical protein